MGISKELQKKLDYYEQIYFSLDKPIPFRGDLMLYPVKVEDYYKFYNGFPCLTMDKTIKYVPDERGRLKKVANIEGISQSYLAYLISQMKDKEKGQLLTAQFLQLLELVFQIDKGFYCPNCHHEVKFQDAFSGLNEFVEKRTNQQIDLLKEELKNKYANIIQDENSDLIDLDNIPQNIIESIKQQSKIEFFTQAQICPNCQNKMRDIFSIKSENGTDKLIIRDIEIDATTFDEFKAIVPRQNILDYEGDKYIDPDLKEELEIKSRLKNSDYTSPTLEKQLICVAIGTGYTLEYLQKMSMRKLAMFLRTIDKKETYYAQLQASLSGMVKFKEDPKHWIFSDDKYNIAKELTDYGDFEKKFEHVT